MNFILLFFFASITSLTTQAALPKPLLDIEKKYLAAKTLEARFSQTQFVAMTGVKKISGGIITIQHPGQFRWETLNPDKNLLVTDGKKFWFYTPPFEAGDRGQVIEKKTNEVQSELASLLLSGAFSKVKNLKIEKVSEKIYKLTPEQGVAGSVKTAQIVIDNQKSLIEKIHLEHDGGNQVDIELQNIKLGQKYDSGFFRFVTPSNTDVIKE
jgi:outer membrane lipoprotein carrier protein